MNAVAMNIGCSTRAIRHLWYRQRLQATGHAGDRPRAGRPRVTMRVKDCYIWNTYLRNRFQTALASAAKTPGTQPYICQNRTQSLVRGLAKWMLTIRFLCFDRTSPRKPC
jgi:hypothetical protein